MTAQRFILNTAVAEGLDVIGDRWALRILQEIFNGKSRFEEFRQGTGASRATLTRRLNGLITNDILYKRPYSSATNRFEYKLTEKGLDLFGASLLARQWELDWVAPQSVNSPTKLFHTRCQQVLLPRVVCRHCRQALHIDDVEWQSLEQELKDQLGEIKSINKHRRVRATSAAQLRETKLADLIGDRWTLLILIVSFFGTHRYDDFLKQLNIAPAILVARLTSLIDANIFERQSYQNNPPRYNYKLTAKGKSLYPFTMALRQWALDWQSGDNTAPSLIHKSCGQPLCVDIDCTACGQKPWTREVHLYADLTGKIEKAF